MKFSKKDVVRILWMFDQLDGAEVVDDALIRNISVMNPSPENTLLRFEYKKTQYWALFDILDDDIGRIETEIQKIESNAEVEMLRSPKFEGTSAVYRGKEMYLARQKNMKKRLDQWLADENKAINRSMWQKYIKNGFVTVNGSKSVKMSQLVGIDDEIHIDIPSVSGSGRELPVMYQDEDVIVIDKPAGVLTHSKGSINDESTVADFFETLNTDQEKTNRTGVVHRLDRDTSGVMIGAKTEKAKKFLQKQFSERKVKKIYYAVVTGRPKTDKAMISLPIARNMKKPTTFLVSPNGREAETVYEVEKTNGDFSLVKLMPRTGRTHQLRVHMAYIGHPIVGDRIYGKEDERLMLHAWSLEVTLPGGRREVFGSELPSEFVQKVS